LDYARLEAEGFPFVIVWAGCRYLSPIGFDEPFHVVVWVEEMRRRAFSLGYRIVHAEDDRTIATGRTVQTFINEAGQARPIPEGIEKRLREAYSSP
jgi:acyl-CoA thioesterase FadM